MDDLITAALEYAARGWSVFPCDPRSKEPLAQGRHRMRWQRYQNERATEAQIRELFSKPANIAIVCGDVSGDLVVRDFDDSIAYRRWSSDHRDLANRLPTVATARGFHVYARMNPCPDTRVLGDGELRANGVYVLAPPSIHPSGAVYRWVVPFCGDAELPVICLSDLDLTEEDRRPTEDRQKTGRRGQKQTEAGQKITEAVCRSVTLDIRHIAAVDASLPASPGHRHKSIFKLARRILGIHRKELPPVETLKRVFDAWWIKALPRIETKDKAKSLLEFLTAVRRAKVPLQDVVFECLPRALANNKPEWSIEFGERVALLAGLCRELQRLKGPEEFHISCRQAGSAIGVSHPVAADHLKLFVALEKLIVVKAGIPGSGKSTRYRYVADDL